MRSIPLVKIGVILSISLLSAGCANQPHVVKPLGKIVATKHWQPMKISDRGVAGTPELFLNIAFINPDRGWLRGEKLYKTANGGKSWLPWSTSGGDISIADSKVVWIAGDAAGPTRISTNGGVNWHTSPKQLPGLASLSAVSATEAWVTVWRDATAIWHTTDAGATWQRVSLPKLTNVGMRDTALFFLDSTHGWVYIRSNDENTIHVLRTADGGRSFQISRIGNMGRYGSPVAMPHIYFLNPNEGWIAFYSPYLLHTTDGGKVWKLITPASLNNGMSVADCSFTDPQSGWAVGQNEQAQAWAAYTRDGGRTWIPIKTGVERFGTSSQFDRVVFLDKKHGWITGVAGHVPTDLDNIADHQVTFVLQYVP